MNPPGFAAEVVALAFGLAASSLFPALMMGIFSRKMNREGAIAGMLAGLISTLVYIFCSRAGFSFPARRWPPTRRRIGSWAFRRKPLARWAHCLNFGVAGVVARLTPAPPAHIQHLVEDIRVPRGAAVDSPQTAGR